MRFQENKQQFIGLKVDKYIQFPFTFKPNDQVYIYIGALHHNPDQWIEPERYIERVKGRGK